MKTRVSDQASFILRRRDWQNSSLILELFTRDYGCIRAIAKGARRNPAKTSYQPFVMLNISWSGRQELKTITGIESSTLPVAEQNYSALLYINELIGAFLPPEEPNPEIFSLYLGLLQQATLDIDASSLRKFELELLNLLGYFPDLSRDASSGQVIRAESRYQFVINHGFVVCADSAKDSVHGQVVLDWLRGEYQLASVLRLAKSVLRSSIDFNLHGKALKSRDVYLEMARRR